MRTRIKLCGMTRPEDAALASSLGADAVGMIFYEKSERNISVSQAKNIISELSPLCSPVAVLVNPEPEFVEGIVEQLDIQLLQFHGSESAQFCEQFKMPYIKAVRMNGSTNLSGFRIQYARARALLLDTFDKNLVGGTGRPFDWSLLDNTEPAEKANVTIAPELMLAGGLGPGNAAEAITRTGIRHIDVNSGIEVSPGIKDHGKMREIMALARMREAPVNC